MIAQRPGQRGFRGFVLLADPKMLRGTDEGNPWIHKNRDWGSADVGKGFEPLRKNPSVGIKGCSVPPRWSKNPPERGLGAPGKDGTRKVGK